MAKKPPEDHLANRRPCAKCGARIGFLKNPETGAALVLDEKPVQVVLPDGTPAFAYTSHWGTCPRAREVRAELDAKKAATSTDEPLPQRGPASHCCVCGRTGLSPTIPYCSKDWSALTPEQQARIGKR